MKQRCFSVLLLLMILITASCKKIPVINKTNAFVSFKIDGVPKEAKGNKNVFGVYYKEQTIVQVVGNIDAAGDQLISIMINNFHGVGEYTTEEDFLGVYNTPEIEDSILSTEGKVKITEYIEGKSIKGEFQFKGQVLQISTDPDAAPAETKVFSEGKFETKITVSSEPIFTP